MIRSTNTIYLIMDMLVNLQPAEDHHTLLIPIHKHTCTMDLKIPT